MSRKTTSGKTEAGKAGGNADDTLILPDSTEDLADQGAARDAVEIDELAQLPRILRYAVRGTRSMTDARLRLFAEIMTAAPDLPGAATWMDDADLTSAIGLAEALDRLAVRKDTPDFRSLADSLRLLTLPMPAAGRLPPGYVRTAKSLLRAAKENDDRHVRTEPLEVAVIIEQVTHGWAALPLLKDKVPDHYSHLALHGADFIGSHMADRRAAKVRRDVERKYEDERNEKKNDDNKANSGADAPEPEIPPGHVMVCRIEEAALNNPKLKEIVRPLKHALDEPLPLVPVPPLHEVRGRLLFEFPYAEKVIDFVLGDLVGRQTIRLRPLILVGEPGGGKSRFVRRLGDILGLGTWRTDASRSDGNAFAGTDKRWYTAEPCHPFLAIAKARHANPLVLIDEIEKAGTRSDYGRFWDCLLGFLEPETASRYPDPALQANLDLTHVSYVATANSLDPIPSPLRDRFRIVEFPKPRPQDMDALLPAILADIAAERGLDVRWITPLAGWERDLITERWNGGSVRRLRRLIEVLLRARERDDLKH
ncbi:MAG: AAA family ATPase [Pseudorhodoplanes sp.]|nr:AAA family ATPase [Pseudorhodoplanes sp.]